MCEPEKARRGAVRPWRFVADWSRHCTRLELLLAEIVRNRACRFLPPKFLLGFNSMGAMLLLLPWHNRFMYPYSVPRLGRAGKSLFMKLLLYSMEFGEDRLRWAEGVRKDDDNASFLGIRGVRVPACDCAAFDALGGVFPLTIGFAGTSSQRKTLDRNYKMMGLVHRRDAATGDVFVEFDAGAKHMIRSQMEREDARCGLRMMAKVALEGGEEEDAQTTGEDEKEKDEEDIIFVGKSVECVDAAPKSPEVEDEQSEDVIFIHK